MVSNPRTMRHRRIAFSKCSLRFCLASLLGAVTLTPSTDAQGAWPDGVFEPRQSRLTPGVAEGAASLSPNSFSPAQIGSYELKVTVGGSGIASGGGLLVDFPKAWFTNPTPLVKPMQQNEPDGFHYIGLSSSNPDVRLSLSVDRLNFDGKTERFRHMLDIGIEGVPLQKDDKVYVTLANTTAPYLAGNDDIRVAIDAKGTGEFRLIEKEAPYNVLCGPIASLRVVAPSQAVVGDAIAVHVTALDNFNNVAESFRGQVTVKGLNEEQIDVIFREEQKGNATLQWTPSDTGYYFPSASSARHDLTHESGPIRVYDTAPRLKVYWGDLHSHSSISKDGIGRDDYHYARDVTYLDFFASTEHDISDNAQDSITPTEWEHIQEEVRQYYEPGRFVTLLAYECSLRGGHHNVFYRGIEGVPWPGHRLQTLENIWAKLEAGDALTIPHHLGIAWGRGNAAPTSPELQEIKTRTTPASGGPQVSWESRQDSRLRPLLEIYSKHGNSESYNPQDPLAYEQVRYTGATSVDGPHYARDAWAAGHVLGTIAASDNHRAHPGLAHTGLAAVIAPELTREAVFDALLARKTYGTTGERILMEFELADATMGERVEASGIATGTVVVAAPSDIAYAEVLRTDGGDAVWRTVARWENPGRLLEEEFTTALSNTPETYYLRTQLESETGGRLVRGWSSPIWVNPPYSH